MLAGLLASVASLNGKTTSPAEIYFSSFLIQNQTFTAVYKNSIIQWAPIIHTTSFPKQVY